MTLPMPMPMLPRPKLRYTRPVLVATWTGRPPAMYPSPMAALTLMRS